MPPTDAITLLRSVPDFPQPGITFYDITPLLQDAAACKQVIDFFAKRAPASIDAVVAIEARGLLFGMPVALALHKPFVPIRKAGKLPRATYSADYQLEYGAARLELHRDALSPGAQVLLIDDVLATGGTCRAAAQLIAQAGAVCTQALFVLELPLLGGRKRLKNIPVGAFCEK